MHQGVRRARIANPRRDTVSREVLRHKEFQDIVQLSRVRDHFICKFGPLFHFMCNITTTPIANIRCLFVSQCGVNRYSSTRKTFHAVSRDLGREMRTT